MVDRATYDASGARALARDERRKQSSSMSFQLATYLHDALALLDESDATLQDVRNDKLRLIAQLAENSQQLGQLSTHARVLHEARLEFEARMERYKVALMAISAGQPSWWNRWIMRPLTEIAQKALVP